MAYTRFYAVWGGVVGGIELGGWAMECRYPHMPFLVLIVRSGNQWRVVYWLALLCRVAGLVLLIVTATHASPSTLVCFGVPNDRHEKAASIGGLCGTCDLVL